MRACWENWKYALTMQVPKGDTALYQWKKIEKDWLALFDTSPLHQFSEFNNFLWVCWFSGKNLSNFVHPLENSKTRQPVLPYGADSPFLLLRTFLLMFSQGAWMALLSIQRIFIYQGPLKKWTDHSILPYLYGVDWNFLSSQKRKSFWQIFIVIIYSECQSWGHGPLIR